MNATTVYGVLLKKIKEITAAGSVTWGSLSGKPETFPPSTHSHTETQIPQGTCLTLADIAFDDELNTTLETCIKQIVSKMDDKGDYRTLRNMIAHMVYPNLFHRIITYLDIDCEAMIINVETSVNGYANTSVVKLYPENTSDMYILTYRFGDGLLGKEKMAHIGTKKILWSGTLEEAGTIDLSDSVTNYDYFIISSGKVNNGTYVSTSVYEYDYPDTVQLNSKMRINTATGHLIVEFPTATTMSVTGDFTEAFRRIIGVKESY